MPFGSRMGALAWSTLLTLYFLGVLNVFLRNSMAVLGPEVAEDLSVQPAALGMIASAFFFAYAAMQVPTGIMLDRYGARPTLCGLMVIATAGVVLFALSDSASLLILGRILMGIGCAGCFTGAYFIFASHIPRNRFAFHGGLFNSTAMLGTLLAAAPLAATTAFLGWRATVLLMAGMSAIGLLLSLMALRERSAASSARIPKPTETLAQSLAGLRQVARIPGMGRLVSTGVGMSAAPVISSLWAGPYLHDVQGMEEIGRGNVLLFMAAMGVISHFALGQLSTRFNTLRGVIIGGTAAVIAALALLAVLGRPPVWAVTILFGVISFGCGYPALVHAHIRAMVPDHLIGRGITLITMGVMGIAALMQLLVGTVIGAFSQEPGAIASQAGYQAAFAFMALAASGAILLYAGIADPMPEAEDAAAATDRAGGESSKTPSVLEGPP